MLREIVARAPTVLDGAELVVVSHNAFLITISCMLRAPQNQRGQVVLPLL